MGKWGYFTPQKVEFFKPLLITGSGAYFEGMMRFERKAVVFLRSTSNNLESCFFMSHLTPCVQCVHPFSKHG